MKYLVFFTIIFAFAVSKIQAQSADSIIKKHIDAHGGTDAIAQIENMKVTGHFTGFSLRKPFTAYKTRSGLYYDKHELGKHTITEGFNGKMAWVIDLWLEIPFPRRMNKTEQLRLHQKADLVTPFYKYKEKGYVAEFEGKENLEGVDVYKIKLTRDNKWEQVWYLNAETFLEYKMESPWTDFAYPTSQFTYFDEFTEVEGVILPFYFERTFGTRYRVTEIEKVEINTNIDSSIFNPPLSEEIERLKQLAGVYTVEVKSFSRRGWRVTDNTESVIEFSFHNILKEKILYQRSIPIAREINWTFDDKAKEYRMIMLNDFYGTASVLTGNFNDSALVVNNVNVNLKKDEEPDVHIKYEIKNITPEGFSIHTYVSRNKGVDWQPQEQLNYSRKN